MDNRFADIERPYLLSDEFSEALEQIGDDADGETTRDALRVHVLPGIMAYMKHIEKIVNAGNAGDRPLLLFALREVADVLEDEMKQDPEVDDLAIYQELRRITGVTAIRTMVPKKENRDESNEYCRGC